MKYFGKIMHKLDYWLNMSVWEPIFPYKYLYAHNTNK